ncbi:hypothetical protein RHGRI_028283 [Rhododendron griersonianum]|uniref:CREG-like beta-barrel domain-containing protein n=1 Tax=Rhododendron griersonianum TaxID=479676 RepID=A0AAV6III4_9ERIC|nr:hypothetical protein RHGRI_028283 [Rhododendron griersonianum]
MKFKPVSGYFLLSLPLLFFLFHNRAEGRLLSLSLSRPKPDAAASFARWLVSQSSWGVLNTLSSDLGGAPFGNVVSFSDGLPDEGHGIPYFYLTTLDPTASNALKDQRSSLTISEYPVGTCGKADPENPTCSKITLTGKLKVVAGNTGEAEFAKKALFTKHPEMKGNDKLWCISCSFSYIRPLFANRYKSFLLPSSSYFLVVQQVGPRITISSSLN